MTDAGILLGFIAWSVFARWLGYRACLREWNEQDPPTQYQGRRASEVREMLREGWTKSAIGGVPILMMPAPPMPPVRPPRVDGPLLFGALAKGCE